MTDVPRSSSATRKPPEIAFASVPDTLAELRVKSDTGLARSEVEIRWKESWANC